jgi:hypothetical protein
MQQPQQSRPEKEKTKKLIRLNMVRFSNSQPNGKESRREFQVTKQWQYCFDPRNVVNRRYGGCLIVQRVGKVGSRTEFKIGLSPMPQKARCQSH